MMNKDPNDDTTIARASLHTGSEFKFSYAFCICSLTLDAALAAAAAISLAFCLAFDGDRNAALCMKASIKPEEAGDTV